MCQIRCWIEDGVCFGGVVFEARSLMSRHFFVLTHSLMHAYAKVCGARPASVKVIRRTCIPFGGLAVALRAVGTAGVGAVHRPRPELPVGLAARRCASTCWWKPFPFRTRKQSACRRQRWHFRSNRQVLVPCLRVT